MGPASRDGETAAPPPAVSFAGDSGVGKTGLLEGVIRALCARGLRVGVIKHSGGFTDPDQAGKDSWRLREAGAERLVLASPSATILFARHPRAEPDFAGRLALLGGGLDLVLVESYGSAGLPTLEVLRRGHTETLRARGAGERIAVVADFEPAGLSVPLLRLEQPEEVADFLVAALALATNRIPG
ncbi:MAG TPA: molybdopterin-guanine dinucleotide biosynthesis protein B [Planctomycetota bacterium]